MPKKADAYHSILIVSSSEQFDAVVKKSLQGFVTIDVRRSAALARRCVLEKYYDLVVVNSPLPDETGEDFAIDAADRSNASVLLTVPQDVFGDALERVTDHGILVMPKTASRGLIDKSIRFLVAVQNRMHEQERKTQAAEEKLEEMRIINKAKFFLVEQKHMTEDDAHRVIGKQAMDNGISRGKAAKNILDEMD